MTRQDPVDEFVSELRRLYGLAGRPPHKVLIRQGKGQQPGVNLNAQKLSDWLKEEGRPVVPTDWAAVRFLTSYLGPIARQASGYDPRGEPWWHDLHDRAQKHRQASRRPAPSSQAQAPVEGAGTELGSVIGELDESYALTLEVHQAIAADEVNRPTLPPYLRRPHDAQLRSELARATGGSRVVMLVGPSSTGKSRACWEAIRAVLPDWGVWHPLTPERPAAVVEALQEPGRIKPRTVIWLNDAQMYLEPSGVGERVSAALQGLLKDPACAPVVILGSMWPDYWRTLTRPGGDDHAAARSLLRIGCDIAVPADFTSADIADNAREISEDPRLRLAAKHGGRRITHHLAGVPELIRRYEHASEHARAVVWAAMDARRLSRWLYLPREFLVNAAPGYLDRHVWDQTGDGEEWLDQALSDLTELCHELPGPLTRSRPLPDEPIPPPWGYRLADYLEQVGRRERARLCPPRTFGRLPSTPAAIPRSSTI